MSFLFDFDSNDGPLSPPTRLDTLLPASIFLLAFLFDIFCSIRYSRVLRLSWQYLSSPFRNFLSLDDLSEPVDHTLPVSQNKGRRLAGLPGLAFIGWVGCLAYGVYMRDKEYATKSLVLSVAWGYIALKMTLKPPLTPPYLLILLAISQDLISLAAFGNDIFKPDGSKSAILDALAMVVPTAFAYIAGTLPLMTYRPSLNVAQPNDVPSSKLTCPEDNVNLWTWVTFTFVQPILDLALKRTLHETDVWSLSPFFSHKNLFHKYQEYHTNYPSHSLLRFLLSSNSLDLTLDVLLEMWSATVGFVSPYALQKILAALALNTPESRSQAYIWTLITFMANLSFGQVDLFQNWYTRRCYERTRGQLFCMLHYKSLKRQDISGKVHREGEENDADLGKILNLMERDTYAVAQRFWEFSGLCTSPVRIAISLTFLYQILGWSALSGVVVVIVAFILDYPILWYTFYLSRSSAKANDVRMRTVNELIQNIRFLKFYGWEFQWSRKAERDRETELQWRIRRNIVETATNFIWQVVWMPSATALISFLCYTLIAKQQLTVSKAFTSIALFSQLQTPMVALPDQVKAMLDAYVSMQRIEDFLKEGEVPGWASSLSSQVIENGNKNEHGIGFSEAAFEWEEMHSSSAPPSRFRLGPLNFVFPSGNLTIVSGATGSGKSALLVALLGGLLLFKMHCTSGQVLINKSNHQVAYCAQNPWLELATIRDNIIFGSSAPFDESRYQSVLDACALRQDLSILDAGDMTEIGEKGITLSGGQRARVALARAMYSQAKVILLDDPLSAVDMHTAQHIVSKCLTGDLARDRTIILVTHHITLCLPVASYLIELDKGKILHHGTIPELEERGFLLKVIETEEESFPQPKSPIHTSFNEMDASQDLSSRLRRQPADGKLVDKEARAEGRVSFRSYITYMRASGISSWVATVTVALLIRAINIGNQVYLAHWGEAYNTEYPALASVTQFMKVDLRFPWKDLPSPNDDVKPWLMIYLYISITGALTVLLYIVIGYYASLQASRRLFTALLRRVTRAPARFFDVTPIGRILNRFTTDIGTIDNALQGSARSCLSGVLNFLASFGFILFMIPSFIPFAFFIAWLYIRLAPSYIQASRDLRRLESISRSPTFAGYDELLRGITHIRAFAMEKRYQDNFYARVDKFQSFDHVYWLVNGWLMWRYDCKLPLFHVRAIVDFCTGLGSVVVFCATIFALFSGLTDGSAAIVIVQAGLFADASRQLIKVAAQLELDFNSVERVVEYLDLPQEAPPIIEKSRPPAYWPSTSGELVVENLVVQYAPKLPAVLHNISFVVRPSEKIGVVGRTGSGKSTLVMSLLRIVEPTGGRIVLDGIDISTLGLEDLRTRVTIVSQDVSLFSGTIRSNLDPLGKHTTEECMQVLERCHLIPLLNHKPTKGEPTVLDIEITQDSLSAGEKQLLALARATLRHTSIIIMDEATSQIDSNLDDQIQRTIREELAGAIVITIAHRLKTVMDYDRILVLEEGRIVEFDTPRSLLSTPKGVFCRMCRKSADWPLFVKMAGESSRQSERSERSRSSEGSL